MDITCMHSDSHGLKYKIGSVLSSYICYKCSKRMSGSNYCKCVICDTHFHLECVVSKIYGLTPDQVIDICNKIITDGIEYDVVIVPPMLQLKIESQNINKRIMKYGLPKQESDEKTLNDSAIKDTFRKCLHKDTILMVREMICQPCSRVNWDKTRVIRTNGRESQIVEDLNDNLIADDLFSKKKKRNSKKEKKRN